MVKQNKNRKFKGKTVNMPRKTVSVSNTKRIALSRPKIINTPTGCIVKHEEFVETVVSAVSDRQPLKFYDYKVNPANGALFPWLCNLARLYETYRFKNFKVSYEPSCPTTSTGSVIVGMDHDVRDPDPTTKRELYAMRGSKRGAVWDSVVYPMDNHDNWKKRLFTEERTAHDDDRTDHIGTLFLALSGFEVQTIKEFGDVFVSYEIEFFTPQMPQTVGDRLVTTNNSANPTDILLDINLGRSALNGAGIVTMVYADTSDRDHYADAQQCLEFLKPFTGKLDVVLAGTGMGTTHSSAPTMHAFSRGIPGFSAFSSNLISSATKASATFLMKANKGHRITFSVPSLTTAASVVMYFVTLINTDIVSRYTLEEFNTLTGFTGTTIYLDGAVHPTS